MGDRGERYAPGVVSVITATYNRAATLPRALDSLLAQTYPRWECVVVDDGSTDDTPAVLARYGDERIRVVTHPVNRGVTAAKNTGLDHATGEWFTMLDSDDEIVPEALATLVETARETGATSVLANVLDSTTGEFAGIGPEADGWLTPQQSATLRGDHWGITRTELLGDMRFNERLPGVETTLWTRLNRRVNRYYLHRALSIYHTEGADMITKRPMTTAEKIAMWAEIGRERDYLDALRELDPDEYRRLVTRVRVARVLRPFVRGVSR